jgi:hypothetical protein
VTASSYHSIFSHPYPFFINNNNVIQLAWYMTDAFHEASLNNRVIWQRIESGTFGIHAESVTA